MRFKNLFLAALLGLALSSPASAAKVIKKEPWQRISSIVSLKAPAWLRLIGSALNPWSLTVGTGTSTNDFHFAVSTGGVVYQKEGIVSFGGNQRGIRAVDLQTNRTIDTAVAAGDYSAIGGGSDNRADLPYSGVFSGLGNQCLGFNCFIGGGSGNTAAGQCSVMGGSGNGCTADFSNIAGGGSNTIPLGGDFGTVCGGNNNGVSGSFATACGGANNGALGAYSFAAGRFASANLNGCYVWADSLNGVPYQCDVPDQWKARASGGFFFDGPVSTFTGTVIAPFFVGDGSQLTNLPTGAGIGFVEDNFLSQANGSNTVFTLSATPSSAFAVNVIVDGLLQSGASDYTYTFPTTITMVTAPANNSSSFFVKYTTGVAPGNSLNTSSQTVSVFNFTGSNQTFGDCVSTLTVTADGGPYRLIFSGNLAGTDPGSSASATIYQDGGFIPPWDETVAMMRAGDGAAGAPSNDIAFNYYFTPAAGQHSFCAAFKTNNGGSAWTLKGASRATVFRIESAR